MRSALRAIAVASFLFLSLAAVPVMAQAPDAPSGPFSKLFVTSDSGSASNSATLAAAPARKSGGSGLAVRGFAGIYSTTGSTGFGFGGGVGGKPFGNQQMEVAGDLAFVRVSGANVFEGTGNFLYNFDIQGQKVTPFAGGGIAFIGSNNEGVKSDAALQILGGVEAPLKSGKAFRGELRFQFFASTVVVVMAGLTF